MMPLNTSLLPPPVEADFNALFAFDDKELVIDPNEEIVSGFYPEVYRGESLRSAFLKAMMTKWECTPNNFADHMGVHSKK